MEGAPQVEGFGDANPVDYTAMKSDPALKYIVRNFNLSHIDADINKRNQLKKQCLKFLKTYGHLPWTTELEYVIDCFTKL